MRQNIKREKSLIGLFYPAYRRNIKIRRPYDRFMVNKHRLASLCATGNKERFLVDETGNRRWLCFRVASIDDPRQWALDYTQLYAQLRDDTPLHSRSGNIYRVYELKPDEQQSNMLAMQDAYMAGNQPGAMEQELPF